jgi:hypothetical protein
MILYFRSIGANDTWERKSIVAIIGVLHALVAARSFRVVSLWAQTGRVSKTRPV